MLFFGELVRVDLHARLVFGSTLPLPELKKEKKEEMKVLETFWTTRKEGKNKIR